MKHHLVQACACGPCGKAAGAAWFIAAHLQGYAGLVDPQPVCMVCAIDAQFCLLFACGDVARGPQAALIAARENGNLCM